MGIAQSIHEQAQGKLERDLAVTAIAAAQALVSVAAESSSGNSSSEIENGIDLTNRLSEDCLEHILKKLPLKDRNSCSLVCKRWLRAEARSRQLLLLSARSELACDLPDLLSRFEHITKLALKCERNIDSIDDGGLVVLGKNATQLQRLKLKGCKMISDKGLEDFSKICGSLRKLSCGSCGFGARGLGAIVANCPLLEDLSIKRLKKLYQVAPGASIGAGRGTLRRLCLKDLANAHIFQGLIAGSSQLRTLILARLSSDWDGLLDAIADRLAQLAEIRMEKIYVGDRGLRAIARCGALQVLYLVRCPEVSDLGLSALAHGCRGLRKLHLDGCLVGRMSDEGLRAVAQRCVELQELVLIRLAVRADSLTLMGFHCAALERLAICNSESFGDGELSIVVLRCLALKKLCIKSCPISDIGLEALAGSEGCPNLVKLKIKKCHGVSVAGASRLRRELEVVVDLPPLARMEQASAIAADAASASSSQSAAPSSRRGASFVKTRFAFLAAPSNFVACTLRRISTPSGVATQRLTS